MVFLVNIWATLNYPVIEIASTMTIMYMYAICIIIDFDIQKLLNNKDNKIKPNMGGL